MIDGVTILATNVVTMTNPVMNAFLISLGIVAGLGFFTSYSWINYRLFRNRRNRRYKSYYSLYNSYYLYSY